MKLFNRPKRDNFDKTLRNLDHSNLEMVYWKLRKTIEELFLIDNMKKEDLDKLQKRFDMIKKERIHRVMEREKKKRELLFKK